jgi:hypothetical protein
VLPLSSVVPACGERFADGASSGGGECSFMRDQKQRGGKGGSKSGSRHGSKADLLATSSSKVELLAEEDDGYTAGADSPTRGKGKGKATKRLAAGTPSSVHEDAEVVGELLEQRAAEALQRKASTTSLNGVEAAAAGEYSTSRG